jgi:glyoxylase-like metal-dependent hydrolase (beta-lactamase superfamily II)
MSNPEVYKVYAIKYATREGKRGEHFFGGVDIHEDESMPMDYYVWAAVSDKHTVVVDTGFTEEVAKKRKRTYLRSPVEALSLLGIDAETVPLVVLTHMHYDHIGTLERFPNATFVLQETEMAFWTGRYASREHFRKIVEEEDVIYLVRENFKGRIRFVDEKEEIVPGITVYRTGGHSPGLQILLINTAKGPVVLASDAAHFYDNINEDKPFSVVASLPEMYRAFDMIRSLADDPELIIPGHDPKVMEKFPPAKEGLEGIAVRIA